MENIVNILTQVTAGAFTGYITNTYAIKMLFKEYTIFKSIKIGGVIIKTKDDFIKRISELVEKDIINDKTLGRELHKEKFKESIDNFTRDFFIEALFERLGDRKIKDLQFSAETIEEAKKYIKKLIENNIEEASDLVFKNITLQDVLSPEQLSISLNNLITIVLKRINDQEVASEFIQEFLKENGHYTIEELFKLSEGILEEEINKIYLENPNLIDRIFAIINKEDLIKNFQSVLGNKKIKDILLPSPRENTLEDLKKSLNIFMESQEGSFLLKELSIEIIKKLKENDKSPMDLLGDDFMSELEEYLENILPFFISQVVLWIKENSKEIEDLIQEGIDETVQGVEGMRGMLLAMIKDTLLTDLASKNMLAQQLVDFINDKINLKEVSSGIYEEIFAFLKKKKISEIIDVLEKNVLINPEILAGYFKKGLNILLDSFGVKLLEKSVGEIYLPNFSEIINSQEAKEIVIKQSTQALNQKLANTLRIPLEDLLPKGNIKYQFTMKKKSFNLQEDISLTMPTVGKEIILTSVENYIKNLKHKDLGSYLNSFNQNQNIHKNTAEKLLNILHINLPQILSGKIEALVADNLNKLTPEEVSEVVHDFMGRELEPITKFGGFLGGIAGLILALTGGGIPLTSFAISPFSLLIYGAVGVLTNVLALEMIFRPYKEKKFLNKIGLSNISQGYIMKNKKSFAKNMGKFVDESLLERRMITSRFENLKMELAFNIKKEISKEDYAIIEKLVNENHSKIESELLEKSLKSVEKNKEIISKNIAEKVSMIEIGKLLGQDFNKIIFYGEEKVRQTYKNLLSSEEKIYKLISPEISHFLKINLEEKIELYLNGVKGLISQIKSQEFMNEPVSSWIGHGRKKDLADKIHEKVEAGLFNEKSIGRISHLIRKKTQEPLNSNSTIGNIFNGKLREYVDNNIPYIMDKLENLILRALVNNKEDIIRKIQLNVYENLAGLQKGGYALMGGDQLIVDVSEHIISTKLPPYLKKSKKDLGMNFKKVLEEKFYTIKLKDIQLSLNEKELDVFITEILSSEATKNNILRVVHSASTEIIAKVAELPLEKIIEIFGKELLILEEDFSHEVDLRKKEISKVISQHILLIIERLTSKISFKDLFENNECFINILGEDRRTGKVFHNLLLKTYNEDLKKLKLENIISPSLLAMDLEKSLEKTIKNPEMQDYIQELIVEIIKDLGENRLSFIAPETKDDILDLIVFSGLDSLEKNLPDILLAVDFKRITEEEINKMEGREIHNLFKSFAGKYFTRLKLWGAIGAGFGIHGGISLLATVSYLMKRGRTSE